MNSKSYNNISMKASESEHVCTCTNQFDHSLGCFVLDVAFGNVEHGNNSVLGNTLENNQGKSIKTEGHVARNQRETTHDNILK